MVQHILGVYAVISAVATVAFIALSLVSKRLESDVFEPTEEFEAAVGDLPSD
jgi:hypothetical protein